MEKEQTSLMEHQESALQQHGASIKLTDENIAIVEFNMKQAEKLVLTVLEEKWDYGFMPGIQRKTLFDPGAAKIMNAFNCYAKHEVLFHTENDDLISWAIEASIIHRESQKVIATGVGACSTREPKYGKRWVEDPTEHGLLEEEIAVLKTKKKDGKKYYHVINPDFGELTHTLFAMASKRAEVDGVKELPGVGTALKKLMAGGVVPSHGEESKPAARKPAKAAASKPAKEPVNQPAKPVADWPSFWSRCAALDISPEKVHEILKVKSVSDWVESGKTLKDAIKVMAEHLSKPEKAKAVDLTPEAATPMAVTEANVPDGAAYEMMASHFFNLTKAKAWAEVNYQGRTDFEKANRQTAWGCWLQLRTAHYHEGIQPELEDNQPDLEPEPETEPGDLDF